MQVEEVKEEEVGYRARGVFHRASMWWELGQQKVSG